MDLYYDKPNKNKENSFHFLLENKSGYVLIVRAYYTKPEAKGGKHD